MKIHFQGGSRTVTGSKFILETDSFTVMIDAGLFQGEKKLRQLNWAPLDFPEEKIDAVILTHGHLDHCGYLPVLCKNGYKGPIYGVFPTLEIAEIVIRDTAHIQEVEAQKANEEGYSKHSPAEPLYTSKDAELCIQQFSVQPPEQWISLSENLKYRHMYVGHILGATYLEIEYKGKTLVFSGDVGRMSDPLLLDPIPPTKADILFIESTYGDRIHPINSDVELLAEYIREAERRNATLLLPSFAVERTQLLMYHLSELRKKGKIGHIPLYVDSPMGLQVLKAFIDNQIWHKLDQAALEEMSRPFHYVQSHEESMSIVQKQGAKVVLAGSGMLSGGRILNYLEKYLSDSTAQLVLTGYQAVGTRGRALIEGAESLKMFGNYIPVHCDIHALEGFSAHADQKELLTFMSALKEAPEKVYLIHGEINAGLALQKCIQEQYSWEVELAPFMQTIEWLDPE